LLAPRCGKGDRGSDRGLVVIEELLVEAHEARESPETPLTTAIFFVGYFARLIAAMMMQDWDQATNFAGQPE
jgi:hypothetical protein